MKISQVPPLCGRQIQSVHYNSVGETLGVKFTDESFLLVTLGKEGLDISFIDKRPVKPFKKAV